MPVPRSRVGATVVLSLALVAVGFSSWPAVSWGPVESAAEPGLAVAALAGLAWLVGDAPARRRLRAALAPTWADLAAVVWIGVVVLGAAVHRLGLRPMLVAADLLAMYGGARLLAAGCAPGDAAGAAADGMVVAGAVHGLVGVVGWLLSLVAHVNVLATIPAGTAYPLIGTVGRASGATFGPNLLAALLTSASVVLVARRVSRRWRRWEASAATAVGAGLILTFSKSLLIVAAVSAALVLAGPVGERLGRRHRSRRRVVTALAVGAPLCLLLVGTHVWLHPRDSATVAEMRRQSIATGQVVARVGSWELETTQYALTKAAAWRVGWRHPLLGVGPGAFVGEIDRMKTTGEYPSTMLTFAPHSTYLGTFAEEGLVGCAALAAVLGAWAMAARSALGRVGGPDTVGLVAALAAAAVEAVVTDVANFRWYWILAGVVATLGSAPVSRVRGGCWSCDP